MAYEKVEVGEWTYYKEGDFIEGILTSVEKDVGPNKSKLYHLESDGKPTIVWGSTVLDPKMSVIKPGDKIKIEYLGLGEAKAGRSAPKLFEVYLDKDTGPDPKPTEDNQES